VHGDDLEPGGESRGEEIEPVRFRPLEAQARAAEPRRFRDRITAGRIGLACFALALLGAAWFTGSAVSVSLRFEPAPDRVSFPGTWLSFSLGDSVLLRPGSHRVRATKDGYLRFESVLDVRAGTDPRFAFTLVEAPGLVTVKTLPPATLPVRINGQELGSTPVLLELPRGSHRITLQGAPDFTEQSVSIEVEGRGATQTLEVRLVSTHSPLTVTSIPKGATLLIDGAERGVTPATVSVAAGLRRVELRLPGYANASAEVEVEVGAAQTLPPFALELAAGTLKLSSNPPGAEVSIGAQSAYRGRTPLTLDLAPGQLHRIRVFKAGYKRAKRDVEVASGERSELSITLEPKLGRIELVVEPADAVVSVDGEQRGPGAQTLDLVAIRHEIVVAKAGHRAKTLHVTPRPGFPQRIKVSLAALQEDRAASRPETLRSSRGQELRLVRGGSFALGSSRQERGRRPNENLVSVEITRLFYLGVREITNREFRGFRPEHRSGTAAGESLDGEEQPVTGVTWADAARYCNWLSHADTLPPAYEERAGTIVAVEPRTRGYRLPTEAEWVWAARYAGGRRATGLRFPWGDEMPPPQGAGNYADTSASGVLPNVLGRYRDGHAVSAPVAQSDADLLGIRDLGGNVAEWVQDFYQIYPRGLEQRFRDPVGPSKGRYRVIRGASWRDSSLSELRLSYRDYGDRARDDVGFRLARDAD
jgi:formylglycine-generating enzyme required for sulfatase activity